MWNINSRMQPFIEGLLINWLMYINTVNFSLSRYGNKVCNRMTENF